MLLQTEPLTELTSPPLHQPANILIIDDESRIRLALRSCLEAEGYAIEEARDGAEAIRVILDTRPDLAILDLAMPGLDGMSMLRELRARYRDVMPRTIVLTAWGSPPVEEEAFLLGVRDFMQKPIVPSVLRTVVDRVLRERVAEQSGDSDPGGSVGDSYLG